MQYFTDKELDRLAGKLGQKLMQEPKVRLMIAGSMEDMPWEGVSTGISSGSNGGWPCPCPRAWRN